MLLLVIVLTVTVCAASSSNPSLPLIKKVSASIKSNCTISQRENDESPGTSLILHNKSPLIRMGGQINKLDLDLVPFIDAKIPIQVVALINVLIHLAWKILPEEIMKENAMESKSNSDRGRWWSSLIASFSHKDTSHISANMAAFAILGPVALDYLGSSRYFLSIIGSGVVSNYASQLYRNLLLTLTDDRESRQIIYNRGSLGFSGIVCSMIVYYAAAKPTELISFGGQQLCQAKDALTTAVITDSMLMLMSLFLPSPIDHAGHLGGFIFGYISIPIYRLLDSIFQSFSHRRSQQRYNVNPYGGSKYGSKYNNRYGSRYPTSSRHSILSSFFPRNLIKLISTAATITFIYGISLHIYHMLDDRNLLPNYLKPTSIYNWKRYQLNRPIIKRYQYHIKKWSLRISKWCREISLYCKKKWNKWFK